MDQVHTACQQEEYSCVLCGLCSVVDMSIILSSLISTQTKQLENKRIQGMRIQSFESELRV